jgi:ATP-dependent Clp protease ATP-binding subunit ClpA
VLKKLDERPGAILFVDEMHTVVGAGAASGGTLDAANLLKPALSSGKLRCIGATTFEEYRSHVERESRPRPALPKDRGARAEPRRDQADLKGLLPRYEEFHNVTYDPDAVTPLPRSPIAPARRKHAGQGHRLMDEAGATPSSRRRHGAGSGRADRDGRRALAPDPAEAGELERQDVLMNLEKDLEL